MLLAVDIVSFCAPHRDEQAQYDLRQTMYSLLREAFRASGLRWTSCHRGDRGDGVLVVFPPDASPRRLLCLFPARLAALLDEANSARPESSRLRLRSAFHVGEVYTDSYGVSGHAVNLLFRLLEADSFKLEVALRPTADLALLVSTPLLTAADPVSAPACTPIEITNKETRTSAWLSFPEPSGFRHPALT